MNNLLEIVKSSLLNNVSLEDMVLILLCINVVLILLIFTIGVNNRKIFNILKKYKNNNIESIINDKSKRIEELISAINTRLNMIRLDDIINSSNSNTTVKTTSKISSKDIKKYFEELKEFITEELSKINNNYENDDDNDEEYDDDDDNDNSIEEIISRLDDIKELVEDTNKMVNEDILNNVSETNEILNNNIEDITEGLDEIKEGISNIKENTETVMNFIEEIDLDKLSSIIDNYEEE